MKNKTTIVILICVAVAMAGLSFFYHTANALVGATATSKDSPSQSLQHLSLSAPVARGQESRESVNLSAADLEKLRVIGNGLRSLKNEDVKARANLATSGKAAMESFLKNWNPIGRKPHDLKALFGEPKEENNDFLLYSFDNGSWASLYQFEIHDGRVSGLSRPLSE